MVPPLLDPVRVVTPFADARRYGRTIMRLSARNQIKGTVADVKKGTTTAHVRVDIGNGVIVTSSITNEAIDDLGIKAGGKVTVVVKASDVMIAVD
jgi:molybdopterin-binding protein